MIDSVHVREQMVVEHGTLREMKRCLLRLPQATFALFGTYTGGAWLAGGVWNTNAIIGMTGTVTAADMAVFAASGTVCYPRGQTEHVVVLDEGNFRL